MTIEYHHIQIKSKLSWQKNHKNHKKRNHKKNCGAPNLLNCDWSTKKGKCSFIQGFYVFHGCNVYVMSQLQTLKFVMLFFISGNADSRLLLLHTFTDRNHSTTKMFSSLRTWWLWLFTFLLFSTNFYHLNE